MIWFILLAGVLLVFVVGALLGAPYVPTLKQSGEDLLDMAELEPGSTIIDLGSGDGAFAKFAAERGHKVIGYEINPLLVVISKLRLRKYRHQVRIVWGDFWRASFPPADAIYVFLIERYMVKLDNKLVAEVKRPTKVISHVFEIPGRRSSKQNQNTFLYVYPPSNVQK